MERWIFHVDMDAFYASVEQRDDPSLRGKPVLVGGTRRRGVVAAASYEARKYGARSAMPMVVALRKCPHAVVVTPKMGAYIDDSRAIMEVLRDYSPTVEPLSLDEAFLDMTGTQKLFGPPREVAERIKRDVAAATGGLTCSVGIAPNKFLAKLASDLNKPDGITMIRHGEEASTIAPLPIRRIWGVGEKTEARMLGHTTDEGCPGTFHQAEPTTNIPAAERSQPGIQYRDRRSVADSIGANGQPLDRSSAGGHQPGRTRTGRYHFGDRHYRYRGMVCQS